MKDYTVYFHNGTMEGDCGDVSLKTQDPNITIKKALKLLMSPKGAVENGWAKDIKDEGNILDFIECNDDFVGAWIVPLSMEKKFKIISDSCEDPGGDSGCYAMQALWKGIYKAFAVKEIGQKATTTVY